MNKLFAKPKAEMKRIHKYCSKKQTYCDYLFYFLSGFFLSLDNHKSIDCKRRGRPIITLLYLFHPPHGHLDIGWLITAESLPLHLASDKI